MRIIEFIDPQSSIATAYAGWLLARMGATVTRLGGHDQPLAADNPESLTQHVLEAGKNHTPWPSSTAAFEASLAACDALLLASPRQLVKVGHTPASLLARLPRLVIAVATTFGLDGPYAQYAGSGLDAQALSGVASALGEPQRAPLSLPPGVVEHEGGVMLAAATLLALEVRDRCGSGRIVDIALADILASYVGGNCRFYIHHGLRWHRSGRRASGSGGAYPFVILPCKDGEVCVFGRTPEEWSRLVRVMGNPAWASDPRYQDLRAMGQQYAEESDALIRPWLAERSKAELETIALANNLILSPIRDFKEVLVTGQFAARKFFYSGEVAGQDLRLPGLPFHVSTSRGETAADIAAELLSGAGSAPPSPPPSPSRETPARPLAGLRVIDFGWVWSAPWVSAMLGELGAEVIKVEHAPRPDNLRLAGRVVRDGRKVEGPSKEMSPMFHQVNHGKLGITLNMKEPRAVELAKQLVALGDVVIENMSPGTMARSGLDYEDLKAVNPRVVMLAMSALGQFGPLANMRAYAPNMSSVAGMEALVGYRGEAPIGALNFALGDPNASAHALLAVLAALRRARLTGAGCYIDVSQIEALLSALRPYVIDSQLHGRQTPTLGNGHPAYAPHGIYPAAEPDAWLTLSIANEGEWQALVQLATGASWSHDAHYATNATRLAYRDALDADLARWTAPQARDVLVARLRAVGLAATPVLGIAEQWTDPHYAARGIKHRVTIPVYGEEDLFAAPWRFSDFAPRIDTCGPATGQHNEQVLGGLLGLSQHEIDALRASGVVA